MLLIHALSGGCGGAFSNGSDHDTWGGGEGVLPIMDYTGMPPPPPKGDLFQAGGT